MKQTIKKAETPSERQRIRTLLLCPIANLDLSVRAYNLLNGADIKTLGELVRFNIWDMMKFRCFGKRALTELENLVFNAGLRFGMDVSAYLDDSDQDTPLSLFEKQRMQKLLQKPVSNLDLSARVQCALKVAQIKTLRELVQLETEALKNLRGLGKKGCDEVSAWLEGANLSLGMDVSLYEPELTAGANNTLAVPQFKTYESVQWYIEQFEDTSLDQDEWTHEGHLLVGLWYLLKHPWHEALTKVRANARRYNQAQAFESAYHETVTVISVWGIDQFLKQADRNKPITELLALLALSHYGQRDFFRTYYSKKRLFSREARLTWLPPDKETIDVHYHPPRKLKMKQGAGVLA